MDFARLAFKAYIVALSGRCTGMPCLHSEMLMLYIAGTGSQDEKVSMAFTTTVTLVAIRSAHPGPVADRWRSAVSL